MREAASELGIAEEEVARALDRGELAAVTDGWTTSIPSEALAAFRRARTAAEEQSPRLSVVPDLVESPVPAPPIEREWSLTLPASVTGFVGRELELSAVAELIARDDVRLVTLTGPGGIGKTRLALEVAGTVRSTFADGAAFVPLAALRAADVVPAAIALALGIWDGDDASVQARITRALHDRQMLLVLDNLEQIGGDGSVFATLLAGCPLLTLLTTSRLPLGLAGERVFVVPPLALPERRIESRRQRELPLADLAMVESIRLFVERAEAAGPFVLTPENAGAVTAICERIDGLPLAIELAAARSAVLSADDLLRRLDQRLPLLSGGPRDRPARLQTMRDAIAWSYDLLDPTVQALFRRLAVFVGGFTVAGAEAVASRAPVQPGEAPIVDAVATLLASSLLQRSSSTSSETRFSMLETVREYGLERLIAAGEEASARSAHANFMRDVVERAQPALWSAKSEPWLVRLEGEHDNIRAALTWSIAHDPELGLQLAAGTAPFWSKRAHWVEGRTWLKRALQADRKGSSAARAAALGRAGAFAGDQGDFGEAERLFAESLSLAEALGEAFTAARTLRGLGIIASDQSDFSRAETHFTAALARFQALGDEGGLSRSLNDLGLVAARQGRHEQAIGYQEEALAIARAMEDDAQACIILGNLGGALVDGGDFARGEALSEEALALSRQLGDTFGVAVNLHNLGNCMVERGEFQRAIPAYKEALTLTSELGERHLASRSLDRLAIAIHRSGAPRQAARLIGAAAGLRESLGDSLFAEEDAYLTARFQAVRDELGDETFSALWEIGRALPFPRAVAEGVALAEAALANPQVADYGLTRRERDVLRLLADGRSDREIAEVLFVSPRTASAHVSAILAKLGVESRAAAVAVAFRQHLV